MGTEAMNTAAHHANSIIPENVSFVKFFLLGLIPEKIRFAFNMSIVPTATLNYFDQIFDYLVTRPKQSATCFIDQMAANTIPEESKFDEKIQKGFTKSEIYSNALAVILAGFETTASSLQFIIFLLCKNPTMQNELFQAAKLIDPSNYNDVKEFKLLDAFIKEVMRMYPPALLNTRYCMEDTEISEELTIEQGTSIIWSNLKFHMSDESYSNPEKFDPSRWDGNESNTLQDEAWFAFGQGPRACPGVRLAYYMMKIYLITLIKNYRICETIETPESSKPHVKNFKLVGEKPLMIKMEKRQKL